MLIDKPIQQFGSVDSVKTTEFQIDITPKLFEMLSGLYPNKIRAVIRELLCNAIDSHIVAGTPDIPVDVYIPSEEYPYLTIKDYGVGMSPDDVIQIYTRYSKSTKTHEASTTGALGLGSKSPFCYTNMFTLKSVHDGVESLYNVYINQHRIPSLTLLSQKPTDDDNGVTVTVPVKKGDYGNFESNLQFVLHHTKSPVRIFNTYRTDDADQVDGEYVGNGQDGVEIEDVTSTFSKFDDIVQHTENKHFHFLRSDPWGNSSSRVYVLQANVIYPVQDRDLVAPLFTAALKPNIGIIVMEVENGSISFSPTREELSMDVQTIDKITSMVDELTAKAKAWSKFYAVYMSRYNKKGKTVCDDELPLVLRKPFWKYLYNYKAIKDNTPQTWSVNRVVGKNGQSYRKTLDGYKTSAPTYRQNLNEASTTSVIGYVITTRYQPEPGQSKLLLEDMINNMYKWFSVKPELNTYGSMRIIVHGRDIREVWKKVKMLGSNITLVEIDESKFQQVYKAPPKPKSPTRLYVMSANAKYTKMTDEKISDFSPYDKYLIRYNKSIVRSVNGVDRTIGMEEFADTITSIHKIHEYFDLPNRPESEKVLVLTYAQYKKLAKDYPHLKPYWDTLDSPILQKLMCDSMLVDSYDEVATRDIFCRKESLNDILEPFFNDTILKKYVNRVMLEYKKVSRLKGYNTSHCRLPQPTDHSHNLFSHWDRRSKMTKITTNLNKLGLGSASADIGVGVSMVSNELTRVNGGYAIYSPYATFVDYIRDVYFHNMYNLQDPDVILVYNNYIRELFKRSNIMSVASMRQAYDHTINLLDKLTTRR